MIVILVSRNVFLVIMLDDRKLMLVEHLVHAKSCSVISRDFVPKKKNNSSLRFYRNKSFVVRVSILTDVKFFTV